MVRQALTAEERARGERLGTVLREARGTRSMVEVAVAAGLSAETLRKVECGRAPTPSLFTVAAVSQVLGLSLDDVVKSASRTSSDVLPNGNGRQRAHSGT
jgi:transcriptional regulator with XRE-family HTH domain